MAGPLLTEPHRRRALLATAAAALVCYAALCKALLFRDLEYTGSDLYGLLDQSRSWLFTGRLLQDNAYGYQAAIHNYYLLPALSPLTVWLGAYGLVVVLAALGLWAVVRAAQARALEMPGRLAVLAGLLSPLAFFAFDDPLWGFHPELLYPPLAVLLALGLLEGRRVEVLVLAAVTMLVKEDGALVCGGVLTAFYARRLWRARSASVAERWRIVRRATVAIGATLLVFVAGLVLLWWVGRAIPKEQATFAERLGRAWGILARTIGPNAPEGRRAAFVELLGGYGAVAALLLLPLGRRAARGLLLLAVSAPPILVVLLVSAAHYKFADPLWAQRVATLLAVVLPCVAMAGADWQGDLGVVAGQGEARKAARGLGWSVPWVLLLGAASWALQLGLLARLDYPLRDRIDLQALWRGRGYAVWALSKGETDFWRCVGARLPAGTPVSPVAELYPFFHRQSIVFQGLEVHAPRPARLRTVRASSAAAGASSATLASTALSPGSSAGSSGSGMCQGPTFRDVVVEADCDLQPVLGQCGWTEGLVLGMPTGAPGR